MFCFVFFLIRIFTVLADTINCAISDSRNLIKAGDSFVSISVFLNSSTKKFFVGYVVLTLVECQQAAILILHIVLYPELQVFLFWG